MAAFPVEVRLLHANGEQRREALELWEGVTVGDTKLAVCMVDQGPPDTERQKVVWKGKQLTPDDKALSAFGVQAGDTLIVAVGGGTPRAPSLDAAAAASSSKQEQQQQQQQQHASPPPQRRDVRARSRTRLLADRSPAGSVCVDLTPARMTTGVPPSWPESVCISPRGRARAGTVGDLAAAVAAAAGGGLPGSLRIALAFRGAILDPAQALADAGLDPAATVVLVAAVVQRAEAPPAGAARRPPPYCGEFCDAAAGAGAALLLVAAALLVRNRTGGGRRG